MGSRGASSGRGGGAAATSTAGNGSTVVLGTPRGYHTKTNAGIPDSYTVDAIMGLKAGSTFTLNDRFGTTTTYTVKNSRRGKTLYYEGRDYAGRPNSAGNSSMTKTRVERILRNTASNAFVEVRAAQ